MRKPTRKGLIRSLDRTVSLYVRARDRRCQTCGTTENLQCGHLFTRAAYSTRWDEMNCFAQCASCNLRHEHNPHPMTLKFIDEYGMENYKELNRRHAKPRKFSDRDLSELSEEFKLKLKTLEGN